MAATGAGPQQKMSKYEAMFKILPQISSFKSISSILFKYRNFVSNILPWWYLKHILYNTKKCNEFNTKKFILTQQ